MAKFTNFNRFFQVPLIVPLGYKFASWYVNFVGEN